MKGDGITKIKRCENEKNKNKNYPWYGATKIIGFQKLKITILGDFHMYFHYERKCNES